MVRNVIFDLYGTLIDIRTDEFSLDFWRKAVQVFAMGGASFSPGELRTSYAKYVKRALRRERSDICIHTNNSCNFGSNKLLLEF